MVIFYVMAVGETIVLVFENVVRVGLGFTAGFGHRVECRRAIWRLLHVVPCLLGCAAADGGGRGGRWHEGDRGGRRLPRGMEAAEAGVRLPRQMEAAVDPRGM